MSDEKAKIIELFPDTTEIDNHPEVRDQHLIDARDEMLAALENIRGRIMAFDLRGLVFAGFAKNVCDDVVFFSTSSTWQPTRTIGAVECMKHKLLCDMQEQSEDY